MPLRVPEREGLSRITIGDAFAYLVRQTIKPDATIDLAAAVHFANARIVQRSTMTAAQAETGLFVLEFLDTDPIDIVSAIRDGVASKRLTLQGMPEQLIEMWATSQWGSSQLVTDWGSGQVVVEVGGRSYRFLPTLDRKEVDTLFAIGGEEVQSSTAEVASEPVEGAGPVAPAALTAAVREIMASERLTEKQAKERAAQRFAPRTFSETLWRAAWKDEPNKRRRGEKPS